MIYHLTIILLCQLAGEFLSQSLDLIVPGPVVGMIILQIRFNSIMTTESEYIVNA